MGRCVCGSGCFVGSPRWGQFIGMLCSAFCDVDHSQCLCRAEDYWLGYKLFCYAYYSHSSTHEAEFQATKLGSTSSSALDFAVFQCGILCSGVFASMVCCLGRLLSDVCAVTGQLVWRRHRGPNPPSHHALRGTCVQLLPLLEMYCKWELQEDCSNLR